MYRDDEQEFGHASRQNLCARRHVDAGQRSEIVKGIHEVINSVEQRPGAAQTYVLINEVATGDWGSAGYVHPPEN